MHWGEIEHEARSKYNLSEEWHLCGVNAEDKEVIQVELRRKGPRGGWLKNKENIHKGFIVNKKY